jgi:predicted RNA binding protein YcfA (HicA-like mRNA interferase family)
VRLPRSLSGPELAKALQRLGYKITRQTGSHMRLTTTMNGRHRVTVPNHSPLRIGTLSSILADIAVHHKMTREHLLGRLFE